MTRFMVFSTLWAPGYDPGEIVTLEMQTYEVGSTQADSTGGFKNVAVTIPQELGTFAPSRFDVTGTGTSSITWATAQIMVT
jgi:hypothetical protein